jgi:gas vesicle protein
MTTAPDLNLLEHDLQQTRARLARDLDRLKSTETISGFKADLLAQASETKDKLAGKAKDAVSAGVRDLWTEMKARAAANPAAALALGAGVAWRLMHRPPIASALVGIGLLSLWRTDPRHPAPGANLAARSAQFFETAKGKAEDASAVLHERAGQIRSAASEWMENTSEAVGNVVQASQETVETVRQRGQEMLPMAADGAKAVVNRLRDFPPSVKERDQILLGAAALALAAAVGVAAQRRLTANP